MQDWAELLVERARSEGVELTGDGGLLTGLIRQVLQTGLEVEMADHLGYERHAPEGRGSGNSRNGSSPKRVTTEIGEIDLGGFNSVKLIFELTVGGVVGQEDDTDTVAVLVLGPFFSGDVGGPDVCANQSLGGPTTYPFDSDGDRVADVCSLKGTRRAAVARQNTLETLAALNPDAFATALHGTPDDPDTPDDESTDGTCVSAPDDLGDSPDDLADDVCGRAEGDEEPERETSFLPSPVDPSLAEVFFSGVITGPSFCANLSLGGPSTYPFDRDDDGVADTCALPHTRREAIARQRALEAAFADHPQFKPALAAACTALGTLHFGDSADALAQDACSVPPDDPELGNPLPSP